MSLPAVNTPGRPLDDDRRRSPIASAAGEPRAHRVVHGAGQRVLLLGTVRASAQDVAIAEIVDLFGHACQGPAPQGPPAPRGTVREDAAPDDDGFQPRRRDGRFSAIEARAGDAAGMRRIGLAAAFQAARAASALRREAAPPSAGRTAADTVWRPRAPSRPLTQRPSMYAVARSTLSIASAQTRRHVAEGGIVGLARPATRPVRISAICAAHDGAAVRAAACGYEVDRLDAVGALVDRRRCGRRA